METQKLARQSLRGVEYQIEYIRTPTSTVGEYRVRRGVSGGYSAWVKTEKITLVINNLGFITNKEPTAVNDFAFEAILKGGKIALNRSIVSNLARTSGTNDLSKYVYSRIKRSADDTWIISSRSITNQIIFNYLKKLITSNP